MHSVLLFPSRTRRSVVLPHLSSTNDFYMLSTFSVFWPTVEVSASSSKLSFLGGGSFRRWTTWLSDLTLFSPWGKQLCSLQTTILFFVFFGLAIEGLQRQREVFIQTVAGSSLRVKQCVKWHRLQVHWNWNEVVLTENTPPEVEAINFYLVPVYFISGPQSEDKCFFSPCSVILSLSGEDPWRNGDTAVMWYAQDRQDTEREKTWHVTNSRLSLSFLYVLPNTAYYCLLLPIMWLVFRGVWGFLIYFLTTVADVQKQL